MERSEVEKPALEDGSQLNRNRSFKSKQLVRSQAIRESTSPPRTISPAYLDAEIPVNVTNTVNNGTSDGSLKDECSNVVSCDGEELKKQPVEIQITGGGWDDASPQRARSNWSHAQHSERDLLSNNPRVACVCGAAATCPHCRGRRRRRTCPRKQDSGVSCAEEDCPDCSEADLTGCQDSLRKAESLEVEEQPYYCRCPERREKPKNITLSRTDSDERSEPSGPELVSFIQETLNKNARDRLALLRIERELHALVGDKGRCVVRFPVMSSYGRMLVHRCAALFQLAHRLDPGSKACVLVSKSGTSGGRIPCTSFRQWCTVAFPPPSPPRPSPPDTTHAKSILKRDTHSLDEPGNGSLANSRSKSLEQREKDYERMKRRIFSTDNCTQSQEESQWPWLSGPVKLLTPETGRNKLLKVQSLESSSGLPPRGGGGRRGVSKSHSFGGYAQPPPAPVPPAAKPLRLLSRQGDLASSSWRLSPSSSGYKTLSLRSTDSVTPSPTGGASPEPCCGVPPPCPTVPRCVPGGSVVWCVTDMSRVPHGAWLLHPQTGRPLANPDGSVYRFDPNNPPVLDQPYPQQETQIDQNDMKRGKLEKQHSFIDLDHGECDCPPSEETTDKCCCDCGRQGPCPQETEKNPSDEAQDTQSPCKTRYEPETETTYESTDIQKSPEIRSNFEATTQTQYSSTNDEAYENYEQYEQRTFETNHRPEYEAGTNDRPPYDAAANQKPPFETPANQKSQQFEPANQRAQNEQVNKLANQDSQEVQYNQYGQGVRMDEVTSPAQSQNLYQQPDMSAQALVQSKGTPVPLPDPNLRTISLNNIVYPTIPQGYYMNQCRMDQPLQQLYQQPAIVAQTEDQKQLASSPHQETTFRIDPSYPYAAVDYAAQCGACVDPNAMRSYNLPYGQVEMPQTVLPPSYPVGNVILPQPQLQHYPYGEAVQWAGSPLLGGKLLLPEPYPALYHQLYQCGLVYPPQVIPQPYPVCAPGYAERTNSAPPAPRRAHPHAHAHAPHARPQPHAHAQHQQYQQYQQYQAQAHTRASPSRRNSDEIAVKIQQIKEQMAELNTRDKDRGGYNKGREEWRKRNNGSGILGSYPHGFQGRTRFEGRPPNDETQLSSAARAIVNSIRNMQAKNTNYHDNRRPEYNNSRPDRPDYRRRPEREPDKDRTDKPDSKDDSDRRFDRRNTPFQYRPPYLLRQMSPGTWCRRSPGPVHPVLNHPRRPHPDTRNPRR